MGIILDSSVIITAERRGHSVRQILEQVQAGQGETEIGLSVVTVAELVHGAYRAQTQAQQERRLEFVERLCRDVPVHPVTLTSHGWWGASKASKRLRAFSSHSRT